MLSRLRKLLHSEKSKSQDQDTRKRMPFITGSQPWLKPYMLAALAHPPQPPALNAHYLQAISPVSSRRELTVYDGRFIIPAVLSQPAASMLDADEDDTGVTTRNLLGHVLAPVSVIVVPDMTTTPPTATLLIKEIRVFADRIHQRPVGRVPFVYTDTEVCDALRAIVGRQLASYATATVLKRADRETEIPGDNNAQETDAFFEKLLHDPSIPPSNLVSHTESFVRNARRGSVVGGGVAADDEHQPLAIIPENPTPSQGDKSKDLQESPTQGDSESHQRDPEWEINFTQDPAEGGNNIGGDLPQTQHFGIDDDDDGDDDDDDDPGGDDEEAKKDVEHTPKDDEVDQPTPDRGKSVGEQRIQEIVGNAQDDTLDGQDLSQSPQQGNPTTSRSPARGTSRNQKSPVKPRKSTSTGGAENTTTVVHKGVRTPPKRKRGTAADSSKGNPTEQNLESPENRRTAGRETKVVERKAGKEVQSGPSNPSPKRQTASDSQKENDTPVMTQSKENRVVTTHGIDEPASVRNEEALDTNRKVEESPGRVTRRAAKLLSAQAGEKAKDGSHTSTPKSAKEIEPETPLTPTRRSPRVAQMKTPPRRPRNPPKVPGESSEEEDVEGSPETLLRRSPRHLGQKNPSQEIPLHDPQSPLRRSPRLGANVLDYQESEEESAEDDDDFVMAPAHGTNADEEETPLGDKELPSVGNVEEEVKNDSKVEGKQAAKETAPSHAKTLAQEQTGEGRGRKRKAPETSSPTDAGKSRRREIEEPESGSPEPFLDKIKAEIEEMKRFRDSIDKNPDAFKAYPDGFLPSAKPARETVRRVLKFPPPLRPVNQPLDVPESAPI